MGGSDMVSLGKKMIPREADGRRRFVEPSAKRTPASGPTHSWLSVRDRNPRLNGGFYFARRGAEFQPHINPVSTGFGLQALMMWRQYLDGELSLSLDPLI